MAFIVSRAGLFFLKCRADYASRQREVRVTIKRVLLEPTVACPREAEHALDDPDRVLDLGSHLRFAVFRLLAHVHDAVMVIAG